MLEIRVEFDSEYGVVFLRDVDVQIVPPVLNDAKVASASESCIAIKVLSYVDGTSTVLLTTQEQEASTKEKQEFSLACPSGTVSLSDHKGLILGSVPIEGVNAEVEIIGSDPMYPDHVVCIIKNAAEF